MKKTLGWLFAVIVLGVAGFSVYLWRQGPTYQPPPIAPAEPPAAAPAPPVASAAPAIKYPVPEKAEKPLPALAQSDPAALNALTEVFGKKARQFFQPEEVIRRVVVTIDNLPRKVVSAQLMPTKPIGGKLRTAGEGETLTMSPENFARYIPFIRLAEMVDARTFVAAYTRLYPLFQQTYRDLGYPDGYFNDRLVAVIDHLLDAPQSEGPIALVQPHVFYKFADPALESLSAGHKLMLRIGNDNAARIKKKLREIRKELVSIPPSG
ncbi:DUF3014 domain-containing protein [Herbaspirillum sp. ST 5-3]|uniref:DUF3014 domain-containing protein n=1 Tax=Oxalobacteraceae TaxID=75682 RepID=UPI0010A4DB30|nr:DUF3014 domain-containing protein [Herbaspirillum sp. ST 5-3]